jgi:hypothetical protein
MEDEDDEDLWVAWAGLVCLGLLLALVLAGIGTALVTWMRDW